MSISKTLLTLAVLAPTAAFAQSADGTVTDEHVPQSDAPPTPTNQLPPVASDHDPAPPVPTPTIPGITGDVIEQAGVGGSVGYGRTGVLELGGAAGLTIAQDMRAVNFSPSVGFFIVDNFELSAILDATNLKAGSESANIWSALAEPRSTSRSTARCSALSAWESAPPT